MRGGCQTAVTAAAHLLDDIARVCELDPSRIAAFPILLADGITGLALPPSEEFATVL